MTDAIQTLDALNGLREELGARIQSFAIVGHDLIGFTLNNSVAKVAEITTPATETVIQPQTNVTESPVVTDEIQDAATPTRVTTNDTEKRPSSEEVAPEVSPEEFGDVPVPAIE